MSPIIFGLYPPFGRIVGVNSVPAAAAALAVVEGARWCGFLSQLLCIPLPRCARLTAAAAAVHVSLDTRCTGRIWVVWCNVHAMDNQ
jgi:hypothetical protein